MAMSGTEYGSKATCMILIRQTRRCGRRMTSRNPARRSAARPAPDRGLNGLGRGRAADANTSRARHEAAAVAAAAKARMVTIIEEASLPEEQRERIAEVLRGGAVDEG